MYTHTNLIYTQCLRMLIFMNIYYNIKSQPVCVRISGEKGYFSINVYVIRYFAIKRDWFRVDSAYGSRVMGSFWVSKHEDFSDLTHIITITSLVSQSFEIKPKPRKVRHSSCIARRMTNQAKVIRKKKQNVLLLFWLINKY